MELYGEALRRGVIVYLPSIPTGGRPVPSTKAGPGGEQTCRDPLKVHRYNAITWSDQGAFTGAMLTIQLSFYNIGRRWFNGKKINLGFKKENLPHIFDKEGGVRHNIVDGSFNISLDSTDSEEDHHH